MSFDPFYGERDGNEPAYLGRPGPGEEPSLGHPSEIPAPPSPGMGSQPAVDIIDNEDAIWVFIDLPGFQQEEVHVRTDQNSLVLTADRPSDVEDHRQVVVNERPTHVERTIPLPVPVKTSGARALYEDGVCKVTLPKTAMDRYEEIEFTSD
jgi:HSP20 family protein